VAECQKALATSDLEKNLQMVPTNISGVTSNNPNRPAPRFGQPAPTVRVPEEFAYLTKVEDDEEPAGPLRRRMSSKNRLEPGYFESVARRRRRLVAATISQPMRLTGGAWGGNHVQPEVWGSGSQYSLVNLVPSGSGEGGPPRRSKT
jgi:hypothetical protein